MKKWDKIIIGLLLVVSFLPYLLLKVLVPQNFNEVYAVITVDGKPYKEIPLTGQVTHKELVINTPHGSNTLVIENEGITVSEATCVDQICMHFGVVKEIGEVIVCLPNHVYIEIVGKDEAENKTNKTNEQIDIRVY